MEGSTTATVRRRRGVWIGVAVVALIAGAGAWWFLSLEPTGKICTGGAPIGTPAAADPEAAFVAWFEQTSWGAGRDGTAVPTLDDFDRSGHSQWRWEYAEEKWVEVDVAEGSGGQWSVRGVGRCEAYDPG